MNPPPNPAAEQARAAMLQHNAEVEARAVQQAVMPLYPYYLTWPATAPAVCCVTGQWRFADSGEIEAWYTREQLEFIVEAIERNREVAQ